jgi:NAD(P)H-hydrate epimerase
MEPTEIAEVVVTAAQMQHLEATLFQAGMPVPALMEKVAGRITQWIVEQYPRDRYPAVGCIIGPGHNGGDALVVARELHHRGYQVLRWCPFADLKELTAQHAAYLDYLQVPSTHNSLDLHRCQVLLDGGFGIGLERSLTGEFADALAAINRWSIPVVGLDVPSGLETDSGAVLGQAVRAQHTLCLGLWKLGLLQDQAQPWIGQAHLIPFDMPMTTVQAGLANMAMHHRITPAMAIRSLPLARSPIAHKYTVGHCLLIAGSRQYAGAALLTARGAIASGVGLVTLVVPESLKLMVVSQVPEALVLGMPETDAGAISALPPDLNWQAYDVVACGPGLTTDVNPVMEAVIRCDRPLVLDADALNWLAQRDPIGLLRSRSVPTLLTPHLGEFRRLFPNALAKTSLPSAAAQAIAPSLDSTVLLKGAITAIAHVNGHLWFNPTSTPALARGGSGDVLTGLVAGIAAQQFQTGTTTDFLSGAIAAVWWHSQTAIAVVADQTVLGCPPSTLANQLSATLAKSLQAQSASSTARPLLTD